LLLCDAPTFSGAVAGEFVSHLRPPKVNARGQNAIGGIVPDANTFSASTDWG
jgi:hypothetical protein